MTTETLMGQAATTTESPPEPNLDGQVGATGAAESGQLPQDGQGQSAPSQENGQPPETKPEAKAEGAPERYEFKAPDGQKFDSAVIDSFSEVAKELNLSQESAQKVLDKMAPVLAERQNEQLQAAREAWAASSRSDKEFGGDRLAENLGTAKKALDAFASPELRTLLEESGLGNHPEVVRMFYRVGKAISEDGIVVGQASPQAAQDARRLYSASNMNP